MTTVTKQTPVDPFGKAFTDEHLSDAFFASALSHDLGTAVDIVALKLSPATSAGDNFGSDIFRAHVTYRKTDANAALETVSLIVKAMPFTEARGPLLNDLQVFDKEVSMYKDTIPRLSQLLGGERLSAKLYYAVKTPIQIIVFEDLKAAGFTMAERTAGIDEQHCTLVLEKLGKFHAASVVLADQDPHSMRNYSFGIIKPKAKPNSVVDAAFVGGIRAVIELMGTWPGYDGTAKKYEQLSENFIAKVDRVCNESKSSYKVLNHGDLWVNNFLFKYDEAGRPVDVCFVDYQMSVYTSPGHDLNYFINTSPSNAVREFKRNQLLQQYHNTFARKLAELQSAQAGRITLELLLAEFSARELYGLLASVGILPIVLMARGGEQELTVDLMIDDSAADKLKQAMFYNPNYVAAMRYIVRRFDEEGVLDRV